MSDDVTVTGPGAGAGLGGPLPKGASQKDTGCASVMTPLKQDLQEHAKALEVCSIGRKRHRSQDIQLANSQPCIVSGTHGRHSASVMDAPQGKKSDTRKYSHVGGSLPRWSQLESLFKTDRTESKGDNLLQFFICIVLHSQIRGFSNVIALH